LIKIRGIVFRLHPLFSLLMLAALATGYFTELLTLFVIVLIHELGHVAAAKSFGWTIVRVELLPFGGVAETDDHGRSSALQEAVVALAGPLQNAWMALLSIALGQLGIWDEPWSSYFTTANVMIGLFNLMPILPLDGGKLMQSFMTRLLPYIRALSLCSLLSLLFACLLAVVALLGIRSDGVHLNMLAIAIFLIVSNFYAYRHAPLRFIRFLMNREPVTARLIDKGTLAQPIVVYRHRKVADIARLFMRDKYHLIYILNEHGRIQAVLPEQKLLYAYFELNRSESAVSDIFVLE
jgi:stage IV sporulation protein FB